MSHDPPTDTDRIVQCLDRIADALNEGVVQIVDADEHDPARIRFFPVNLYAAMERAQIVACAECGCFLANDAEGANRSQHAEWHEVTLTKRGPR